MIIGTVSIAVNLLVLVVQDFPPPDLGSGPTDPLILHNAHNIRQASLVPLYHLLLIMWTTSQQLPSSTNWITLSPVNGIKSRSTLSTVIENSKASSRNPTRPISISNMTSRIITSNHEVQTPPEDNSPVNGEFSLKSQLLSGQDVSHKALPGDVFPVVPELQIPKQPVPQQPVNQKPKLEQSIAEQSAPQEPISQEPAQENAMLQQSVPVQPVLNGTFHQQPLPSNSLLQQSVAQAMHQQPMVQNRVPQQSVSEQPILNGVLHQQPILQQLMPAQTILHSPVLQHSIPEQPAVNGALQQHPIPQKSTFVPASTRLQKMIKETDKLIVCPGVYDGLSARIAHEVGFDALYMVSINSCGPSAHKYNELTVFS